MIGWFRDRLRQSLDRVGLDAGARRGCAPHAFGPLGNFYPLQKDPSPIPNHTRFESSFRGLSRVNDSLTQINVVQWRISESKGLQICPLVESETGTRAVC